MGRWVSRHLMRYGVKNVFGRADKVTASHRSPSRIPTARQPADGIGKTSVDTLMRIDNSEYDQIDTYVISGGIPKHVVECIFFRNVFSRFANHDGQLDLVVRQMLVHRLSDFGDLDRSVCPYESGGRFVEQNGVSEQAMISMAPDSAASSHTHGG